MPFHKCAALTKRKGEIVSEHEYGSLFHTTVTAHCLQYFSQRVWRGTETQPGAPKKVWNQNWRNYRLNRCCTRMESEGGGWHIKTNRREQKKKVTLNKTRPSAQCKVWKEDVTNRQATIKGANGGIRNHRQVRGRFGDQPERHPERVCWVGQRWDVGMAQSWGWAVPATVIHRKPPTQPAAEDPAV